MPTLHVNILKGYTDEDKEHLTEALVSTVAGILNAPGDGVVVWLHESSPSEYRRGHHLRKIRVSAPIHPAEMVKKYLAAMEARNIEKAKSFLAPEFHMTFPGGVTFHTLEDLVNWSKTRYRFVKKTFHSTNTSYGAEFISVTCSGVLSGEWPNGEEFHGVRFIDQFQIKDGLLVEQSVWNDLELAMPKLLPT